MSQTLILFWQDNTDSYDWQLINKDGGFTRHQSSLDIAAQALDLEASVYKFILIIPSTACFFTEVKVPPGADSKIVAALPYLIEEKLADEPENFFIARLSKVDAQRWHIAAMNREWFAHIIQSCRAHHLEPDVAIPDILLLPYVEHSMTVAVNQEYAWIRYKKTLGLQLERGELSLIVATLLIDETLPRNIVLVCDPADRQVIESELTAKGLLVTEWREISDWAIFFGNASRIATDNLLQNEFAARRKYTKETRLYKIAGILLVAWLGLTLVGKIAQYVYFKHRFEVTQTEIEANYRKLFPDMTRVVSPKATLQKELAKLNEDRQNGRFLFLMTEFAKAITGFTSAQIENLDYKNTVLTVTLRVDNFTVLKEIGQKLAADGFDVKQENAVSQNGAVQARLILKKGKP